MTFIFISCNESKEENLMENVYGCIDENATNYNLLANTDDGSCITPIYGCMDSTMFNYNPLANTDNGTCEMFVYGCTYLRVFSSYRVKYV